jgi:hypothetical protein
MQAAYMLARLAPKVQHFTIEPSGFNGITPIEITWALARVRSPGARLLGRVKWSDQRQFMHALAVEFEAAARLRLAYANIPVRNDDQFLHVLATALLENINPSLCRDCHGTGILYEVINAQVERKNCPTCDGLGSRTRSERWRARTARLDRKVWRRDYSVIYSDELLPILDYWDELLLSVIKKSLR